MFSPKIKNKKPNTSNIQERNSIIKSDGEKGNNTAGTNRNSQTLNKRMSSRPANSFNIEDREHIESQNSQNGNSIQQNLSQTLVGAPTIKINK